MRQIRLLTLTLLSLLLFIPAAIAGPLAKYQEAREVFIAAAACMATYNDRYGGFAMSALQQEGWEIIPFVQKGKYADARFLFAKKIFPDSSHPFYLLAVTGTETEKDIRVDLSWDKIPFATKSSLSINQLPKVHQGFYQYLRTAGEAEVVDEENGRPQDLLNILLAHPEQKIYLTGHSLGGAVVTLAAASLLEAGVKPQQIEVITFGAPAVGNTAFKDLFEARLNLTRITIHGDPIPLALQRIPGGYTQFGQETSWKKPDYIGQNPHDIASYLDLAMKQYYHIRQAAVQAGALSLPDDSAASRETPTVYIAPVKNSLPEELHAEFSYMQEVLQDEYRDILPGYIFDKAASATDDPIQKARSLGCQWAIITEFQADRLKDKNNEYYISMLQAVYRISDKTLIDAAGYGTSTRNLTPLEAFFHNAKSMREGCNKWLSTLK
ncbi:MAG TPA: lipase family protein [Methylomusa anaerophila]|uniref:Lipase n=1 Tax=Methylomusa anaerophila TaxID=1930071 RepID=A0A348ALZ6_9FIRM|nr:lipase family protein [Methylomusa anaerophila]BBB92094.1 Lipase [Methylomusa anaerophila]HML87892.1 lipase family protein [Methylomusa anaerophila]